MVLPLNGTNQCSNSWRQTPLKTFDRVLQKREIPVSWRETIISVIPKDGKDKLDCGNYHPISILNIDYKLFVSILSKRIENILPGLTHFMDKSGRFHPTKTNTR